MRAITASGIVPSAIVGRIRCDSAERNAPASPARSVSISMKPVACRNVELDRDAARHRRPAELHREEQDQQQRPPEDRHRIAGQRDAHHRVIGDGVALERRDDAGRQADRRRRTASRRTRARSSPGNSVRNSSQHRLVRRQRRAEIALQHLADVVGVLHRQRPVEPELVQQPRRAAPGPCRARPTGSRPDRRESGGSARTRAASRR